jgi:hypothetical protein
VKEKICKLIDVKSIVTLAMTLEMMVLLLTPVEPSKEILALFCTSYGSVMTYYFTKKDQQ